MGAASVSLPVFAVATVISLGASWVLATRIERLGLHFGLSWAFVGVVAAFAADTPEITSAITAFGNHQSTVGAGVVLGSNVFNLAALLGLSALISSRIRLHRRVVLLSGVVGVWVASMSVLTAIGPLSAAACLVLVLVVLVPYVAVLGMRRARLRRLPLPRTWTVWLVRAIGEEESELAEAESHRAFRRLDLWIAGISLLIVVGASVTMERAASALGRRYAVSDLIIGAVVLAGVTSLPNAVTASYLALRGRGAAVLSTALNSNTLNVAVGWLLPATIVGVAVKSSGEPLVAWFYFGLTLVSLTIAYCSRGLDRRAALVIVGTYLAFVGAVLASAGLSPIWIVVGLVCGMAVPTGLIATAAHKRRDTDDQQRRSSEVLLSTYVSTNGHRGRQTLVPGWSVNRLSAIGFASAALVAAVDSALGPRVLLLGLVSVAPCCVLLARRWRLTALAGIWAIGLTVLLGLPDGIWATSAHAVFVGSVSLVSVVATVAAFSIERLTSTRS